MTSGHPLVWLTLLVVLSSIAVSSTSLVLLVTVLLAILITGLTVGGPRRGSLTTALGFTLLTSMVWFGYTMLVPRNQPGSAVLFVLPAHSPGPGVHIGGPVTLSAATSGLVSALQTSCLLLSLGLAGQLVSARGWLALSRSALGPLSPALGWWCSLGEASSNALTFRHRGLGGWASQWLLGAARIASGHPFRPAPPWADAVRSSMSLLIAVVPLATWLSRGELAAANISGIDLLALMTLIIAAVGMCLPGAQPLLKQWRWEDLPQALAAVALGTAWALRHLLVTADTIQPDVPTSLEAPLLLITTVLLLPASVLAASLFPRRSVTHV